MISFEGFVLEDGSPIYEQILRHIQRGVVAGVIGDGDELPSRRALSALLGVNPNTVQKAYRLLEEASLVQSHSGARSYVVLEPGAAARIRAQLLEADTRAFLRAMRQMGVQRGEALALVEQFWEEDAP